MVTPPDYTRGRLQQLGERMRRRIYSEVQPVAELQVSGAVERIGYQEAQRLRYRPVTLGQQFGPLWATFWFRGRARVPRDWKGSRVDLLWVSHSEATLWLDGQPVQGLNHDPTGWDRSTRPDAVLSRRAAGGDSIRFQIEMACNRPFGAPLTPVVQNVSPFVLDRCDIARFDPEAWDMYHDFAVLQDLEVDLAKEGAGSERAWAGELLSELNRFANLYDIDDRNSWRPARRILRQLYAHRTADRTHELTAIGHAHIDTAWLWPIAETQRKCVRTFSSQTRLMEEYPEFRFACSQAYQYSQVQVQQPQLFARIKAAVRRGQWVPVGGTWVEPDCNLPAGESLVRQFLYGQRYFEQNFGRRCGELWNPDVFGYNGQLPQIMRGAGIGYFLTQKLSWNRYNKPAHHTFVWRGIDGSEVLAHFPPADTYNATASVAELRRSMRDYKDHLRSRHALMLFGYGDGGGGPTKTMLEVLRRAGDLQGLPRTRARSSADFFALLESERKPPFGRPPAVFPTLIGELYFEYHRGTYTSQAQIKRLNRRSEELLHDVECLSSWTQALQSPRTVGAATRKGRRGAVARQLESMWKQLLVQHFHDILPGSSIAQVYVDSERSFAAIQDGGTQLRTQSLRQLARQLGGRRGSSVINTTPFARAEVVQGADGLRYATAAAYAVGAFSEAREPVRLRRSGTRLILENRHLTAVLGRDGSLVRLRHRASGRETLARRGNVLEIYEDRPTAFDAWDIDPFHLETGKPCAPATSRRVTTDTALRLEVQFERAIGKRSRMRQIVRLDAESQRLEFACHVDWRESHALLKVAFPVNVRAMQATYEMQFGCVERPTHFNTSYDLARYEVPAHRWADLSEHGFGVALLSESKYGFSTRDNVMRMSLLRAPKYPDPSADMREHSFAYALYPHSGTWQEAGVVAQARCFNQPLLVSDRALPSAQFVAVDDANLVLDTIKPAEDDNALVLRFYEAHGSRGSARLRLGFTAKRAALCNLLEDEERPVPLRGQELRLLYSPFQILTLKLAL